MIAAAFIVAFCLAVDLALIVGRWIGRRESQSMTPVQAERHLHGPEVRGKVIDLAERRRAAPRFSSRRQQHQ